jgi:hypothetical protein
MASGNYILYMKGASAGLGDLSIARSSGLAMSDVRVEWTTSVPLVLDLLRRCEAENASPQDRVPISAHCQGCRSTDC